MNGWLCKQLSKLLDHIPPFGFASSTLSAGYEHLQRWFCEGLFSKLALVIGGVPALVLPQFCPTLSPTGSSLIESAHCWLQTPRISAGELPKSQTLVRIQFSTCAVGLWPCIPVSAVTAPERVPTWLSKSVLLTQPWASHPHVAGVTPMKRWRAKHLEEKVGAMLYFNKEVKKGSDNMGIYFERSSSQRHHSHSKCLYVKKHCIQWIRSHRGTDPSERGGRKSPIVRSPP